MKNILYIIIGVALLTSLGVQAQTFADTLGLSVAQWQIAEGPQYVSVVAINPRHHRAGIGISPNMKSLSRLASEHRALVAINGSYYNMSKGNSVCFLKVEDTVADSTESREFRIRVNGAIAVRKGKLRILPWTKAIERNYKKKHGTVLASGPLLLQNGHVCDLSQCDSGFVYTRHPRSAIAITKKKQVLFITVDGRAPQHAIGMSLPEMAQLIKQLGGVTAINLDGGGSTMLYLDGHILNHPTDNGRFDHEGERKIPNMIYFR